MKNGTREWLKSAKLDLENISYIISVETLTPVITFHSQQCVEKCLKALLEEYKSKVPKEHSVIKLHAAVQDCTELIIDEEILSDFDNIYIETRYPGASGLLPEGIPSLAEAKSFYDFAKDLYENVVNRLSR